MAQESFQIEISPASVRVRYEVSKESPHGRFYACFFLVLFVIAMMSFLLFAPGKHGSPSMWSDLRAYPGSSWILSSPMILLALGFAVFLWYLARYVPYAYPGDQEILCDKEKITVSWVPWLDWSNSHRELESYPLSYVSRIRYGAVASGKGSVNGLRFRASGKEYKLFPALSQDEAGKILTALEALGADVER